MTNLVLFAHGKESGPWGTKIKYLARIARRQRFKVESPDYSDTTDAALRVKMLLKINPEAKKHLVLVGSSMGGYVSAVASRSLKVSGLFLLAPAFYLLRYPELDPNPRAVRTTIIHGWRDNIVPVENSVRYAKEFKSDLHILDSDHRLTDVLPQIGKIFEDFLLQIKKNKI